MLDATIIAANITNGWYFLNIIYWLLSKTYIYLVITDPNYWPDLFHRIYNTIV